MTVGETLTKARHQAGLSVDELSERTRIRETVIRSIERDDYQACGGDLYVRGYVRAIAGAVGIDAQPLIHEYDQVHEIAETPELAQTAEIRAVGADLDATRFDLTPIPGDTETTRFDLPAVRDGYRQAGEDLMAAGYDLPSTGSAAPDRRGRVAAAGAASTRSGHRGRGLLAVLAAVIALAVVGTVGIRLASSSTTTRNTAATTVPKTVTSSAAATRKAAKPTASAVAPKKSAAPTTSATSAKSTGLAPVTSLPIAVAEAFGPDGLADGDNPENAQDAITGGASQPWSTQWYATPDFGMLKHGTGLLLDLGRRVTVTSVRLDLSSYQGANLELMVGDAAVPGGFKVAASASDTGGVVRLSLHHQESARYLLVWFTLLPPDGAGHYAEAVAGVYVNGRR